MDESSSEQQIRESDNYIWIVRKNWSPRPSATGSYGRQAGGRAGGQAGRQAGRQADEIILSLKIFKIL